MLSVFNLTNPRNRSPRRTTIYEPWKLTDAVPCPHRAFVSYSGYRYLVQKDSRPALWYNFRTGELGYGEPFGDLAAAVQSAFDRKDRHGRTKPQWRVSLAHSHSEPPITHEQLTALDNGHPPLDFNNIIPCPHDGWLSMNNIRVMILSEGEPAVWYNTTGEKILGYREPCHRHLAAVIASRFDRRRFDGTPSPRAWVTIAPTCCPPPVSWAQLQPLSMTSFLDCSSEHMRGSILSQLSETPAPAGELVFFALGDFGGATCATNALADAMDRWAQQHARPEFIVGLGDNFYPRGVSSVDDGQFENSWENVFLAHHPALCVPWCQSLGNHDYNGNAEAQLQYTHDPRNRDACWQLPARNYRYSRSISGSLCGGTIEFFHLDTNAVQLDGDRGCPSSQDLRASIAELDSQLASSDAKWKIVCAHHPIYTQSDHHGELGRRLGGGGEHVHNGRPRKGFGLEEVLLRRGVVAYLSGHEHRMQHHCVGGLHHFVAGAGGYTNGFCNRRDLSVDMEWVDESGSNGFVVVRATMERLQFQYVSSDCAVLREYEVLG